MPCCDPSMSLIDQLFSNTCQYCYGGQAAQQQQLQAQQNTTGVPCCDPSAGFFTNLFSNTCNTCDPIGNVLGSGGLGITGAGVPTWVWLGGALMLGTLLLGGRK